MTKLEYLNKYKENAKSLNLFGIIFIVIGFVSMILFTFSLMFADFATLSGRNFKYIYLSFIPVLIGIILLFAYGKEYKKYASVYKGTVVHAALSRVFSEYDYTPNKGFSFEYIKSLGLVDLGNNFRSSDLIKAKYKDVNTRL